VLHRETFPLRRHGWIAFGQRLPADPGTREEAIEFYCG
jgi:hypothetical protein